MELRITLPHVVPCAGAGLRSDSPGAAGRSFPLRLLGAVVGATVGSALVFLLQHFVFHDDEDGVAAFFAVLFLTYLVMPFLVPPIRRFLGPRDR
jgi:hypothetical protein